MVDLYAGGGTVTPEALPGRPYPRLPDEANPQAYGGQVGQAVEQSADILQGVHDRTMEQARKAQFADADNQLQTMSSQLTHDPNNGAFTKTGQAAFGLDQQYLPQYWQRAQGIIDSTPDPQVKAQLKIQAQNRATELSSQLGTYELREHQKFYDGTYASAAQLAIKGASENYNDPAIISSNLDKLDGALQHRADLNGWAPEQLEETTHAMHVKLHEGVLDSMMSDGKLDMAGSYLASIKGDLSPIEYAQSLKAFESAQAGATAQSIVGAYRTLGPDAGAKIYAQLDQSDLSDAAKDQVREHVRQGLSLWNEQSRQQYAKQVTALDTAIASGSPGADTRVLADGLYHHGALNLEQYSAALGGIARAEKSDQADAERLAAASDAFTNRKPLDPKDTEAVKGAGLLFSKLTAGAPPGSDTYSNSAVAITDHVGIIPKDVVSYGRATIDAGDPKAAAAAANVLSRLQQTNPRAYGYAVDDKTRVMVSTIANAVQAGTDPEAAVTLARDNAKLPKPQLDALEAKWGKPTGPIMKSQPDALASLLKSDPVFKPGFFSGLPSVPPLMQGEFDSLTREYFKQTNGNIQQARALAANDLKHTWGVSEVNGRREIMQYAPEAMFPGLTPTVVRSDIAKTIGDNADTFQKVDPGKVRLTATDRTARSDGQDWTLSVPDRFGAYDVVRGKDGNPLTYRLPVAPNDYGAARARQAQADIESARRTQQLRRDAAAGQEWSIENQGAM